MAPTTQADLDTLLAADAITSASLLGRATSPIHHIVKRALPADPDKYDPGHGVRPPETFNNKGYFALFAILGAAMVVVSIWFFFWAKNGGFHWEQGDWDDYKTTVLRRKDKNGKTLTNATPPTNLGEKSIAGTWDIEKDDRGDIEAQDFAHPRRTNNSGKRARPSRNHREPSDEDLRAYRRERSAKVGGLNRQQDGSQFASSNHSRSDFGSDISARPLRPSPLKQEHAPPPAKKGFMEKKREKAAEKKAAKEEKKREKDAAKKPKERPRHTFAADEMSNADMSQTYRREPQAETYLNYRPPAPPHAASRRHEARQSSRQYPTSGSPHRGSPSGTRQPSPTKPAAARQQRHPGSFDAYSDAGTSDTGTKVYSHHIPGISREGNGTRDRRAMYGGMDSDSDEDNDDFAGFRRR